MECGGEDTDRILKRHSEEIVDPNLSKPIFHNLRNESVASEVKEGSYVLCDETSATSSSNVRGTWKLAAAKGTDKADYSVGIT